jgi:hypothetical protein
MTDLERKVFKALLSTIQRQFPGEEIDYEILAALAKSAVQELTTGAASGRRMKEQGRRVPDPGSKPERIRYLARRIEGSFHTMPNGWVSVDHSQGVPSE